MQARTAGWSGRAYLQIIAGTVKIIGHQERNKIQGEVDKKLFHPQRSQTVYLYLPETRADGEYLFTKSDDKINRQQSKKTDEQSLEQHRNFSGAGHGNLSFQSVAVSFDYDKIEHRPQSKAKNLQADEPEDQAVCVLDVGSMDKICRYPLVDDALASGYGPGCRCDAKQRRKD